MLITALKVFHIKTEGVGGQVSEGMGRRGRGPSL